MILKYEKFTPTSYDYERGEEYGDTEDFEYEVDATDVKSALKSILMPSIKEVSSKADRVLIAKGLQIAIKAIDDADILDDFAEAYREEITDHFESDAFEWYEE